MRRFTIQLGSSVTHYVPAITGAPKAYDGFGTITVNCLSHLPGDIRPPTRIILIPEAFFEWQTGRYSSGLYGCDTEFTDVTFDSAGVIDTLNNRINPE